MKSSFLLLSVLLLLTWPSLASESADEDDEPILFQSGVTAELLTNIFQGLLPALFE